jgi:hypothetical protein
MQGLSIVGCTLLVLGVQAEQDRAPAQKTNPSAAADIVKQLREEADQLEKSHASHFFDALIGAIESGDRRAVSAQLPPMLKDDGEAIGNALRAPELEQTCITTQSVTHAHSPAMRVLSTSTLRDGHNLRPGRNV